MSTPTTVGQIREACRGLPDDALVVQRGFSVFWRLRLVGRSAPSVLREEIKCPRSDGERGREGALVLEVDNGQS